MKTNFYKSLDQLVGSPEERVPLSTRVKKDTKIYLGREAKVRGLTISTLSAAILDDYCQTFHKQRRNK